MYYFNEIIYYDRHVNLVFVFENGIYCCCFCIYLTFFQKKTPNLWKIIDS